LNILNPLNSADLVIQLKLNQVFDFNGAVASAPGTLNVVLRATIEDRDGGDMTTVDYLIQFPFQVQGNKAALKTTANARLNQLGLPGLPGCSSIEVLGIHVLDENGNAFATPGTFLPEL
jgi:hypothetical protein